MKYPVLIKQLDLDVYQAKIPDVESPDCLKGQTVDEVLSQAQIAIQEMIVQAIDEGRSIPTPKRIADYRAGMKDDDVIWSLVAIDVAKLYGKSIRYNITFPEKLMNQVDGIAKRKRMSRSALLADAAITYLSREL